MHFLLHCTNFLIPRQTLFQKIKNIDDNILCQSETQLTQTYLFGNQNYHSSINRLINSSTEYLIPETCLSWDYYILCNLFFICSGVLINAIPDESLKYIGFNLFKFLILRPCK